MTVQNNALVLTHGTLEIRDVKNSMHFYRDFLGMNTIQHVPFGCRISLNSDCYIICLETKDAREMPLLNHFGMDVGSREEVDEWHRRAEAQAEEFGIKKLTRPILSHGAYQFYIKDCDNNWWEIQHYEGEATEAHLKWGQSRFEAAAKRGQ